MSRGVPRMCIRITGAPACAHTSLLSGSKVSPEMSLTIVAPAARARRATSALTVSTDTGTPSSTAFS